MANDPVDNCRDRLHELSMKLEQSHLVYLQMDDSPLKLQQRQKLEGFIKEYLCLVPNEGKYVFQETADILHRSAATVEGFSGYRACIAWRAISLYAANLLAQPWRREYRTMRTYSGYYKHEVEANLIGAELLFELMGYKHTGLGVLTLEGPIDPDKVSNISRDAIVAFVECQILIQIWESVSQYLAISWLEVLEFREHHAGTPEQAIRALKYQILEKVQQQLRSKHIGYRDYCQPVVLSGAADRTTTRTIPYRAASNNYIAPSLSPCQQEYRYLEEPNSQAINCGYFQPVDHSSSGNRCVDNYDYPAPDYSCFADIPVTRYYATMPAYAARVPTSQLIEIDSPSTDATYEKPHNRRAPPRIADRDVTDFYQVPTRERGRCEYSKVEKKCPKAPLSATEPNPYESWEFVYKDLESLGYSKDLGDREDVLHKELNTRAPRGRVKSHSKEHENRQVRQHHFENKRKGGQSGHSDTTPINGHSTEQQEPSFPMSRESNSFDLLDLNTPRIDDFDDRNKKSTSQMPPKQRGYHSNEQIAKLTDAFKNTELAQKTERPDENQNRWKCATCTFLNKTERDICEMCWKSRHKGNEDKPLASGGKECPKCTLVNEKSVTSCAACDTCLEDSPTYI